MLPGGCERSGAPALSKKKSSPINSRLATFPSSSPPPNSVSLALKKVSASTLKWLTKARRWILGEVREPPRQGMRASAESVDRKRFIVSSLESGGSGEGGRRGGAGDTRWRAAAPHLAACVRVLLPQRSPNLLSVGRLNSHLSVCSKMAVVFYLTGNFLLIGLLSEFDSVPV